MDTLKFFGLADLACSFYVHKCDAVMVDIINKPDLSDINDVIALFNLLRYADAGLSSRWEAPALSHVRALLGSFTGTVETLGLKNIHACLSPEYYGDYWLLFSTFGWYKRFSPDCFRDFLHSARPPIRPILRQKVLVNNYRDPLKEYFLESPENAVVIIENKNKSISPAVDNRFHLPDNLSKEELQLLFKQYVHSADCSYGALEIISNMNEISPRTRLQARRKAKEIATNLFSKGNCFKMIVEIMYVKQNEPVVISYNNGIIKYSYDIKLITDHYDSPTILNNFINLFHYIDSVGIITLISKSSELGIVDKISGEREDCYTTGIAYMHKNQAALMQIYTYSKILDSLGTSIESMIEWFFRDFVRENFGINNFRVSMPTSATSYVDKCRILAPEIERIIKQYEIYIEDGAIDPELLEIASQPTSVASCGSLVSHKYGYSSSADIQRAIYYFFSDQCMLSYFSSKQKSYGSFYERLNHEELTYDSFEAYQRVDIDWLIEHGYLAHNESEKLVIANNISVNLLRDLYLNECVVYCKYPKEFRNVIDRMSSEGLLRLESSLFADGEKQYLDFHLNRSKYINSLDLRNRYVHGSNPAAFNDESASTQDYYLLLKIVVLIVAKIYDDLEQKKGEEIGSEKGSEKGSVP